MILPLTHDRIDEVVALGKRMHAESGFAQFDWYEPKLIDLAYRCIEKPDNAAFIATAQDEVIGVIAAHISEFYFGRDKCCWDYLWYVAPDHRGGSAGIRLMRALGEWAMKNGAKALHVGVNANINSAEVGKIMQKLGFDHQGGNYRMAFNV